MTRSCATRNGAALAALPTALRFLLVATLAAGAAVLGAHGAVAAVIGKADRLGSADLRTNGRYVDFAPADGAAVDRNPPPLTWPWNPLTLKPWDPPGTWTFRLTVARDAKLAVPVLQEKLEFNTFAMLPTLEPGAECFWRVEWLDAKGQVAATGPVRRFTVARDARRYDLSSLRKLPTLGHPRVCCRPEDVSKLRALRDGDSAFGRAARGNRDQARRVADYGKLAVGWSLCPQIWELASAHLLWGDTDARFAKLGVEGLVRVCRDGLNRPEGVPGGDYGGNFHTMLLFAAYDWLYDALSAEQRTVCLDELARRATGMFQAGRVCFEGTAEGRDASHPLELLGQGTGAAWALYEERPELARQLVAGLNYVLAGPGPYSEGRGWTEGRGYGRSHLLYLSQLVLAPMQIGLKLPLAEYGRWGAMARFFALLSPVGEDREPFGDGAAYWPRGWGFPVLLAAALAGDGDTCRRLVLKGEDKRVFSMLNSGVTYGAEPPTLAYYVPLPAATQPAVRGRLLAPDAGFVIEHTDSLAADRSVGFVFKCSPLGWTNHCHADQGSFALYAWGQLLACNTGSYQGPGGGYGSAQDQNFNKVTVSKNSLLINGQGQVRTMAAKSWQGRIIAYHADDRYVYTCGSFAATYGPRARATGVYRHMLLVRDRYFVIFDDVQLAEPAKVQWLYHLPGESRLDRLDADPAFGAKLDYHNGEVKVLCRIVGSGITGAANDQALGADRVDYTAQQGAPATHLSFARSLPVRNQQFLAVVVPYRDGSPGGAVAVDVLDEHHVRVTCDGQADLIGFGSGAKDTVDYQAIQQGK